MLKSQKPSNTKQQRPAQWRWWHALRRMPLFQWAWAEQPAQRAALRIV